MLNMRLTVSFTTHGRSTPSKTYYSFFFSTLFSPSLLPLSQLPFPFLLFPHPLSVRSRAAVARRSCASEGGRAPATSPGRRGRGTPPPPGSHAPWAAARRWIHLLGSHGRALHHCSCRRLLDSVSISLISPSSELDHGGPLAFPVLRAKLDLGATQERSLSSGMEPSSHVPWAA